MNRSEVTPQGLTIRLLPSGGEGSSRLKGRVVLPEVIIEKGHYIKLRRYPTTKPGSSES